MADKDRLVYLQRIKDRNIVSRPGPDVVAIFRLARGQESPAGNPNDAEVISKLECELLKYVRVVTQPREQHHRRSRAAPVQHLQLDVRGDRNKSDPMRGFIRTRCRL